ncbi:MAG: 50S ribosomal protein L6 [bacterium]
MSRVGKEPISLVKGVDVSINAKEIVVKGPKGELKQEIIPGIEIKKDNGNLVVTYSCFDRKKYKIMALHGLYRSLIANMVKGVTEGFTKILDIEGIGYRANVSGSVLNMALGYSHPIEYPIPAGISIEVEKSGSIIIKGYDKQQVGQVAAEIKSYKKVEPYKGKGIRYRNEAVRRKVGKAGAK